MLVEYGAGEKRLSHSHEKKFLAKNSIFDSDIIISKLLMFNFITAIVLLLFLIKAVLLSRYGS